MERKVMNPADAYRKELRKELKRNKKERKKVREVRLLKKDLEALREQIEKLERMKADGTLDKARKHKKRQLEDTLKLVLKKRKVTPVPPPPPPPPGLPPKLAMQQSVPYHPNLSPIMPLSSNDNSTPLVPPPPRQPPPLVVHSIPLMNPLQNGMIPPDSPPPPLPPPGIVPPPIPQPVFVAPPGPPPFPRALFQPGLPNPQEDLEALRPSAPQKPSYIKSAASTVVKRPLAQHNPELTAMVPASVRVRRKTAATKVKAKSHHPFMASIFKPSIPASALKPHSIDDSYTAFLKDMKALGALDG